MLTASLPVLLADLIISSVESLLLFFIAFYSRHWLKCIVEIVLAKGFKELLWGRVFI